MIDKEHLDKLLNGYIDGELGQRQQTEVKRLIKHDEQIAARLRQFEKCRALVNALPVEEAPAEIVEVVKERIENQAHPPIAYQQYDRSEGAKQLMHRKILAMAAMVALAGVLGVVVYTIIAPDQSVEAPTIAELQPKPQPAAEVSTDTAIIAAETAEQEPAAEAVESEAVEPAEAAAPAKQIFTATLELSTANKRQVDAFIQRTIADNEMLRQQPLFAAQQDGIYAISGSIEGLSLLLADLASVWHHFASASLYVETEQPGRKVVVNNIIPQQIDKIALQEDSEAMVATAKDFAALNRISAPIRTDEVVSVMPGDDLELMPIPKPALTSNKPESEKTAEPLTQQFSLTVVINEAD